MQQPVYLSSPPRLKHTPILAGEYVRPGTNLSEMGLDDAYLEGLLASGEATLTPPGTPEPPPRPDPLPPWEDHPPDPTPGVKAAWLAEDFDAVWPDGAGRIYGPNARIDLYAPDRVAAMVASGRASHTRPKFEGSSWRLTTVGGVTADGKPTAAPISGNRREIENVRRP
jgi:hypothetical protein